MLTSPSPDNAIILIPGIGSEIANAIQPPSPMPNLNKINSTMLKIWIMLDNGLYVKAANLCF